MFPEYHTSADNLELRLGRAPGRIGAHRAAKSWTSSTATVATGTCSRTASRSWASAGLYRAIGGTNIPDLQIAMLWVLNQSDGETSLLHIAERAGIRFSVIQTAADLLRDHDLLAPA